MGLRLECALCRSGRQLCRVFRALAFRMIAGYRAQARKNSVVMSYLRACVDSLTPCRPTDGPCISISYGYCSSSFRMQTYCLDGTASQLAMMANAAACTLVASQAPAAQESNTQLVLVQALCHSWSRNGSYRTGRVCLAPSSGTFERTSGPGQRMPRFCGSLPLTEVCSSR